MIIFQFYFLFIYAKQRSFPDWFDDCITLNLMAKPTRVSSKTNGNRPNKIQIYQILLYCQLSNKNHPVNRHPSKCMKVLKKVICKNITGIPTKRLKNSNIRKIKKKTIAPWSSADASFSNCIMFYFSALLTSKESRPYLQI